MINTRQTFYKAALTAGFACFLLAPQVAADIVHADDVIIQGSACIGDDCVDGESFGFGVIRLKEGNLRIHFDDTSNTASFPKNDWQIEINSSANGGAEYFGVRDITADSLPFRIEAGAPSNSLYVEDDGDVGIGTSIPQQLLHVVSGSTPALRIEQDGSSGFDPQIWDVAGNDSGFFVRDTTNGSTLPFRIEPGAPTDSLRIGPDGHLGLGTGFPIAPLHISRSNGTAKLLVEEMSGTLASRTVLELRNNGNPRIDLVDSNSGVTWRYESVGGGGSFRFFRVGSPIALGVGAVGNVTVAGTLTTGGPQCGGGCDEVFDPNYELESIEQHAAAMWENSHLPAVGPTESGQSMNLTEKVGGLINELEKAHIYIERLHERLREEESRNDELEKRLARVESLLGADGAAD